MAFWAVEVKAGKSAVYVPPPEQARLRLSQVMFFITSSNESNWNTCVVLHPYYNLLRRIHTGEYIGVCNLEYPALESYSSAITAL